MTESNGYFITFEGSEGAGKTTQISRLAESLEKEGYPVLVTREPGGTAIGEEIRHILKHTGSSRNFFPETELLLFAAARAQLVREVLVPAMEKGTVILCDRFLDSTTVYQGVARRIASDPVSQINTFAVGDLVPDLTFIIDIPAEVGLQRIRHRVSEFPDRMEQENIDFYQRVREGYLILAKAVPERFHILDGTQSIDQVAAEIWDAVCDRMA